MKNKLFWLFVVMCAVFFSCNTDENPVPMVRVDARISINNAEFASLQNPGGWAYVTGGYGGIFVYNFDNSTYYAYDRACTCDHGHAPLVYDEKTRTLCHQDTVANCSSRFNVVLKGAVEHGPAVFPLRQYNVSVYDAFIRITDNQSNF